VTLKNIDFGWSLSLLLQHSEYTGLKSLRIKVHDEVHIEKKFKILGVLIEKNWTLLAPDNRIRTVVLKLQYSVLVRPCHSRNVPTSTDKIT
jgi:hypothetical protein